MKRFNDVIRILSSILLGLVVREWDGLCKNVDSILCHSNLLFQTVDLTFITCCILVITFLRNIHGSTQYDKFTENGAKYQPLFEDCAFGRFVALGFGVFALFFGPYFTAHMLAFHSQPVEPTARALAFYLFLPFGIYLVWDLLLWLFERDQSQGDASMMPEVVNSWVRIDGGALLMGLATLFVYLWLSVHNRPFLAGYVIVSFDLIAVFILFSDYIRNHRFYFTSSP
ncbi:MAG: hypothetical protein HYR55_07620 [Acidobacteria bacterium]|nr:hypothetical protein [Acidobacteriota bacterium]MBI3658292.1 hypothetical protein [Acidobacteriota bacterium]